MHLMPICINRPGYSKTVVLGVVMILDEEIGENPKDSMSLYIEQIKFRLQTEDYLKLSFGEFIDYLPVLQSGNELEQEAIIYLAEIFHQNGLSSEPRIGHGLIKRTLDSPLYIYSNPGSLDIHSVSYRQGVLMLRMAVLMSKVDGAVDDTEALVTLNFVRKMNYLTKIEKGALLAKANYFLDSGQKYDEPSREYIRLALNKENLIFKLPEMSKTASSIVLKIAKDIAIADGHIGRSELILLQDMYKALNMSARSVKSDLEKYAQKNYMEIKFWNKDNLIQDKEFDEIDDVLGSILDDFDEY